MADQINENTQLQAFLAKRGAIIVKEDMCIGRLSALYSVVCEFTAIVVWQPGSESDKFKGVQVCLKRSDDGNEESEAAFLDLDELDSLSTALTYLVDAARKWSGETREYIEMTYKSADDFRVGFYQNQRKQVPFISAGHGGGLCGFLSSIEDLTRLKTLSDSAISKLRDK